MTVKDTFKDYDIDENLADIINAMQGDNYLDHAKKLGMLCCTNEEICAFFGCSETALINRKNKDTAFAEALNLGRQTGKLSLRRDQFNLAKEGNATMQIWMGKQILNQREHTKVSIDFDDCVNNREKTEKILLAVSRGDMTVQDGAMVMNMAKTVVDEQAIDAMNRLDKLEKLAHGE